MARGKRSDGREVSRKCKVKRNVMREREAFGEGDRWVKHRDVDIPRDTFYNVIPILILIIHETLLVMAKT
ncbi:hypothetical protein GOBAR_DD18057 [Gossypium barbadense]|nr:hypothetical protein GOBAR_DD18057 [Gossypium barbadense]